MSLSLLVGIWVPGFNQNFEHDVGKIFQEFRPEHIVECFPLVLQTWLLYVKFFVVVVPRPLSGWRRPFVLAGFGLLFFRCFGDCRVHLIESKQLVYFCSLVGFSRCKVFSILFPTWWGVPVKSNNGRVHYLTSGSPFSFCIFTLVVSESLLSVKGVNFQP